ncbi:MAG: FG-GAP-like repeat-containing protein [Planctomycetota bacterium]|jgi:hypothetical protein
MRAAILSFLLLAGCGPVAIGLGINELLSEDDPDLLDPIVRIRDGAAGGDSFSELEPVTFRLVTNKQPRSFSVYVELAPFRAQPDANGCPRDGEGDLFERFGRDFDGLTRVSAQEYQLDFFADPADFPTGAFEVQARIWVRAIDAQGRIACESRVFRVDRSPPGPPNGVAVRAEHPRRIEVSWDRSEETDVVGYRIRWDVPHENGAVTTSIPPPEPFDRTPGVTYRNPVDVGSAPAQGVFVEGRETTAATLRDLYGLRPHFVQVVAVDIAGNESPLGAAQELSIRTRAGPDGRFRAAQDAPDMPGGSVVADFNADRLPDTGLTSCNGGELIVDLHLAQRASDGSISYERVTYLPEDYPVLQNGSCIGSDNQYRHSVAADFNGDGHQDLATAIGDGIAVVFFGERDAQGHPTLIDAIKFEVIDANHVAALLGGDRNGDGRADLLAIHPQTSPLTGDLSLTRVGYTQFLGDGDGGFDPSYHTQNAIEAISVQANAAAQGDFDRDGVLDFVVADIATLSVVLCNRDGSPKSVQSVGTQAPSVALAVGDYTGDRVDDLAVSNVDRSLVILAGRPDGTFAFERRIDDVAGGAIAAGEFNGDGRADLALGQEGVVRILLAAADGGFEEGVPLPWATSGGELHVADLDQDRILDLLGPFGTAYHGRGTLGVGVTGFRLASVFDVTTLVDPEAGSSRKAQGFVWPCTADMDGDGVLDIVMGVTATDAGLLLVANGIGTNGRGVGSFGQPVSYSTRLAPRISTLAVGDFDRDGNPDVAVGDTDPFGLRSPQLFPGVGDGLLGPARDLKIPPESPAEFFVTDFDLDGTDDLATVQGFAEEGSQARRAGIYYDGATVLERFPNGFNLITTAASGDFDGDGLPDWVGNNGEFAVFELIVFTGGLIDGVPSRTLNEAPVTLAGSSAEAIASADIDGDGRDDLLFARRDGFFVRLANGTPGLFGPTVEIDPDGPPAGNYLKLADWNGDGLVDAMVGGAIYAANSDADGRPDATFTRGAGVPLGFSFETMQYQRSANGRIAIGDFDADGIPDIAVSTDDLNVVAVEIHLGGGRIADR